MKAVTDILFDLDRTLWHFEANAYETLLEIYNNHDLKAKGIPSQKQFIDTYKRINAAMWGKYRIGKITKEFLRNYRFYNTIKVYGIENFALAESMATYYVTRSPYKTKLMPGAREVLEKLADRYTMHIITNGFSEVQYRKLHNCGIEHFFKTVTTSEEARAVKPDPRFFEYAIEKAAITKEQALVVGDDRRVDIEGALRAGIAAVWYNADANDRAGCQARMITKLSELPRVLQDC